MEYLPYATSVNLGGNYRLIHMNLRHKKHPNQRIFKAFDMAPNVLLSQNLIFCKGITAQPTKHELILLLKV